MFALFHIDKKNGYDYKYTSLKNPEVVSKFFTKKFRSFSVQNV